MYLHLGQNVVVPESAIIGVFDMDNTTGSRITRKFLNEAEKSGRVLSVTNELPKSFVICCEDKYQRYDEMKIYISQLSSQTLLKRSGTLRFD